jgi:hypothetical protein
MSLQFAIALESKYQGEAICEGRKVLDVKKVKFDKINVKNNS